MMLKNENVFLECWFWLSLAFLWYWVAWWLVSLESVFGARLAGLLWGFEKLLQNENVWASWMMWKMCFLSVVFGSTLGFLMVSNSMISSEHETCIWFRFCNLIAIIHKLCCWYSLPAIGTAEDFFFLSIVLVLSGCNQDSTFAVTRILKLLLEISNLCEFGLCLLCFENNFYPYAYVFVLWRMFLGTLAHCAVLSRIFAQISDCSIWLIWFIGHHLHVIKPA